jgi:hypothetical protein
MSVGSRLQGIAGTSDGTALAPRGATDRDGRAPAATGLEVRDVLALQDAHIERLQRQTVRAYIAQAADLMAREDQEKLISDAPATPGPIVKNAASKSVTFSIKGERDAAGDVLVLRANFLRLTGELLLNPKDTVKSLDCDSEYHATYVMALEHIEKDDPLRIHFDKCLHYARERLINFPNFA